MADPGRQKRMGRPPIPAEDRRRNVFRLRLTDDELAWLHAQIDQHPGVTIAQLIRDIIADAASEWTEDRGPLHITDHTKSRPVRH